MSKVFLLRHGETEWNKEGNRYCGSTNLPLTPKGIEQAKALSHRLKKENIRVIYSSPLKRAALTAEIIAGIDSLPVNLIPEFREIDYGEWEGLRVEEIKRKYGREFFARWRKDPYHIQVPGGENLKAVESRVIPAFNKIISCRDDNVVAIVAHNTVNRIILCNLLGISLQRYRSIKQDNACCNIILIQEDQPLICQINDTCHLKELGS